MNPRLMPAGVRVVDCRVAVAIIGLDIHHVMVSDCYHTSGWMGRWESAPVRGQEEVSNRVAEDFNADPTATKR